MAYDDYNQPPELQDISRQRKLADILQQQSMQSPEGQMVSGHYVAPSITQNLARLLQGYESNKINSDSNQTVKDYQSRKSQDLAALLKNETPSNTDVLGYVSKYGDSPEAKMMEARMLQQYKQKNGADPYFTPIPTENGLGAFNNRTGGFEVIQGPDGKPYIKPADSPQVRGNVAGAEAQAKAAWKPNTDIPGVVSTDAQVVNQAYGDNPIPFSGLPVVNQQPQSPQAQMPPQAQPPMPQPQGQMPTNNFSTPYPVTWNGHPGIGGAPGTTSTDLVEGVNGPQDVALRDPSRPNMPVRGIRVPTPLEVKQKEADIEKAKQLDLAAQKPIVDATAEAKIELPKIIAQAENTSKLIDQLVGSRDGKIKPHPGFEAAVGLSSKLDPRNYIAGTDATGFNVRLDQLKGQQFLQAFSSLKGGGSITEVEGKKATDAISRMNSAVSEDEFKTAARDFQDVIQLGLQRARAKAGGAANTATPSPQAIMDELKRRGLVK